MVVLRASQQAHRTYDRQNSECAWPSVNKRTAERQPYTLMQYLLGGQILTCAEETILVYLQTLNFRRFFFRSERCWEHSACAIQVLHHRKVNRTRFISGCLLLLPKSLPNSLRNTLSWTSRTVQCNKAIDMRPMVMMFITNKHNGNINSHVDEVNEVPDCQNFLTNFGYSVKILFLRTQNISAVVTIHTRR